MNLTIIEYNSPGYEAMISLRNEILRKPIGLLLTPEDKIKEKDDIFIVCSEENVLIGCCILKKISASEMQLRQMAVQNNQQKKGIGAALLEFAEATAKKNHVSRIILHARGTATDFYKKYGYQICSEEFTEVGIPHYEMEKKL